MFRKKKPTWTTADGSVLLIEEMDDLHIINSIRMLWKGSLRRAFTEGVRMISGPTPHGDGATLAHERELAIVSEPTEYLPDSYYDLIREANKRGLKYE